MAVQRAKNSAPVKNNGGTVVNGGAVEASSPMSKNLTVIDQAVGDNGYGSKLLEKTGSNAASADPTGIKKARPSGTFAYSPEKAGTRNFILRAAGTASAGKINGTSTTLLNSTGSEFAGVSRGKTNSKVSETRLGVDQYSYPAVSMPNGTKYPGITRDENRGVVYNFKSTTDNGADSSDKVLTANRAIPGELTYRTGAPMPKTTNIPPRDSAEV
jgi:hypothetical protein